ncbi:hypothetical protein Agub_g6554 [Astrephomene gubernaculifera]|uniref:Uncharacterized protein n=1 Tax=Astrephomene gubernaculifera TaxID=47775 RepID=A0AAD3HKY5_9CHLO|nr:hypothetical protein Agub_g6554 [Astrephomene gubernaculifera]
MESNGGPRVAYVVVTKGLDYPTAEDRRPSGARYTRDAIRGMLQFMGCKPRHSYKAAQLVFQKLERFASEGSKFSYGSRQLWDVGPHDEGSVYVAMPRSEFYELICSTLTEYNYKYVPSSDEIKAACSLRERRRHVIVLLCGTSGSGKSTLASILASRLGISTVLSTDSVRHMMRSFTSAAETPLLFASTYEAGEALRKQQALDEARRQQQQQLLHQHGSPAHQAQQPPPAQGGAAASAAPDASGSRLENQPSSNPAPVPACATSAAHVAAGHASSVPSTAATAAAPAPSAHDQAIRGYKAQCELVSEQLEQLICGFEARRQSLVVEGVHLHVGLVMRLLQRHPGVVPFLVYIKSEGKHTERMAVRAKYMTLDPNKNKYVKNMRNIRWIQDYLLRKAEKHAIPCVENSNIDRSVGLIHLTLLGCLKRMMKGEQILDGGSSSVRMLHNEFSTVVESLAGTTLAAGPTAPAAVAAAVAGGQQVPRAESFNSSSQQQQQRMQLGSPRSFKRESAPMASRGPSGDDAGVEVDAVSAARVNSSSQVDALLQQLQEMGQIGVTLPLSSSPQQQAGSAPAQQSQGKTCNVSCGSSPSEPMPWGPASSSPEQRLVGARGDNGHKVGLSRPPDAVLFGFATSQATGPGAASSALLPGEGAASATRAAGFFGPGAEGKELSFTSAAAAGPFVLLSPPLSPHRDAHAAIHASAKTVGSHLPQQQQQQQENGSGSGSNSSMAPRTASFCGGASPSRGPMLLSSLLRLACQQQPPQQQQQLLAPHGSSPPRDSQDETHSCGQRQTHGQQPVQAGEQQEASPPFVPFVGMSPQRPANSFERRVSGQDGVLQVAPCSPVYGAPLYDSSLASGTDKDRSSKAIECGGTAGLKGSAGGSAGVATEGSSRGNGERLAAVSGTALAVRDAGDPLIHRAASSAAIAVGSPLSRSRNANCLSAEQQQHLDAVLPAWVRQLEPRIGSPAKSGSGGGGGGVGMGVLPPLPVCPPSVPVSGESERCLHGCQAVLKGHGVGGVGGFTDAVGGSAAAAGSGQDAPVDALETNGVDGRVGPPAVLLDAPTAAAAAAATASALSRFGNDCSDEVLAAAVASAILDEQMDGVTEPDMSNARQQGQHSQQGSRRSTATGSGHVSGGPSRKCTSGNGAPYSTDSGSMASGSALPLKPPGGEAQSQSPDSHPCTEVAMSACAACGGDPLYHMQTPAETACIPGSPAVSGFTSTAAASVQPASSGPPPQMPHATPNGVGSSMSGMGAFAVAPSWAAAAAVGSPSFLRSGSRCLGESSSPSRSGYSSDEGDGANDDSTAAGSGAWPARRRSHVGALGRDVEADSDDDPDDEAYGGASPLQEYGSVYESATHDDMDEHGDEEEALPLEQGRSNTIIKHLASALERSRMRASASAAAGRLPGGHRSPCPPPAASSGAASRGGIGRRRSGRVSQRGLLASSTAGCGGGDAGAGGSNSPGMQLMRQMLRGGAMARLVTPAAAADTAAAAPSQQCMPSQERAVGQSGASASAECNVSSGVAGVTESSDTGAGRMHGVAGSVGNVDAGVDTEGRKAGVTNADEKQIGARLLTPFASPI